jgi:NAD(P)-dependent dehydrogenase (short-subunit alcohol dehydrogenase family)
MASNNSSKIVLVTGANQGLGLAVIEVAGKRYPSNTYVLCARDIEKGQQAVHQLRDRGVSAAIDVVELDVTNDDHIANAVKYVDAHYGRLDGKYKICLCFRFSRDTARDNARLTKGGCFLRR